MLDALEACNSSAEMLAVLDSVMPDTEALEEYFRKGAMASIDADEVSAGHCNQHGHVPGCDKRDAGKNTIIQLAEEVRNAQFGFRPDDKVKHELTLIHPDTVKAIVDAFGVDLEGYIHAISEEGLYHAIKEHPSLSADELRHIVEAADDWQHLSFEVSKGIKKIKYHSTFAGNDYISVYRVGNAKRRNTPKYLHFTTFYRKEKEGRRENTKMVRRLGFSPNAESS